MGNGGRAVNCRPDKRIDSVLTRGDGLGAMKESSRHRSYDTSTGSRGRMFWRDLTAWLGAILLAVNTLASSVIAAPQLNVFGEPLEICAAHGLIVADSGQPSVPDHQGCQDCCPCCLPLLHGGAIPPTVVAFLPLATEIAAIFPPAAGRQVIPARRPDSAAPRAPPIA